MAKHSIQIENDLYDDITSYCKSNGLKVNAFCEEMLKRFFLSEKYGDIPFGTVKLPTHPKPNEEKAVKEFATKMIDGMKKGDETMAEIVGNCGGSDNYNDMISDIIFDDKKEGDTENKMKNDTDAKVVKLIERNIINKPRKRRLK